MARSYPPGDPRNAPKYQRALDRIAEGQKRRPHGKPQNQTAIDQARKLVREIERNAAKQAADKPRWDKAEERRLRRQANRLDRRVARQVDKLLTRGDLKSAERMISQGRRAAEQANEARKQAQSKCGTCNGTGSVGFWKKSICHKCKGTGKKR